MVACPSSAIKLGLASTQEVRALGSPGRTANALKATSAVAGKVSEREPWVSSTDKTCVPETELLMRAWYKP